MKKTFTLLALFFIGISVAFVIGTRVGVSGFLNADAQYKASIIATQLAALRAGKPDAVIVGMEISLNGELANHGKHLESNLAWLWPELKSKDDRPIRRAVTYRITNPYQDPDLSKTESWNPGMDMNKQFVKETIEAQKSNNRYLKKTLNLYAEVTHNSSHHPSPKADPTE